MGLFKKLFGSTSEKELKKIQPIVDKVLNYEEEYSKLTDTELKNKTNEFKARLANGETLDDILPEAFATVREASYRVLGMKHYPVQIKGGIILHQGRIAQLATGEGKTLTATLPVYLNALAGNGIHVVTVNDYLAKRDSLWMGKVYTFLGLSVGLIIHGKTNEERKEAYACDITYGTNNEIGFDYLKDNMAYSVSQLVQRGLNFAIVDEVDSVLIDEARTPLIISGFDGKSTDGYKKANEFVKKLKKKVIVELEEQNAIQQMASQMQPEQTEDYSDYDYIVEEKKKTTMLTERGVEKAEKFYGIENLSDPENVEINHYITRSLKAHGIFKKDVDYVIKDGNIVIVDESTGRLMDGRRYSEGIHQAIEAKENVKIQQESKTLASITFQNLFRKYNKLSGMTGTAMTEEEEFGQIYGLDIVEIPTNLPVARIDKTDKVYINRNAKLRAIIETIKYCQLRGQPVLVGTVSVEKSEELSRLLKKEKIKHTVLNAKYHEQEAKIVAQAGKYGAVTIATNMAGRGTDIILGGNPEFLALEELRKEKYPEELINEATSYSTTDNEDIINIRKLFKEKESRIKQELQPEVEKVKASGGLYIIGSERHESRRIDNQLRGRSGRQGDVGVSEFVISLEDDLMRLFGSDKMLNLAQSMNVPDDIPLDMKLLSNNIENAQKRIESQFYGMRKNVLEYDEILAKQRDIIYDERHKLLTDTVDLQALSLKMMKEIIELRVDESFSNSKKITRDELELLKENLEEVRFAIKIKDYTDSELNSITSNEILNDLLSQMEDNFNYLIAHTNKDFMKAYIKKILLFYIDSYWQDHMIAIDELKKGIGLRAYGQVNPIDAFRNESFDMFDEMMNSIKYEILKNLMMSTVNVKKKILLIQAQKAV